MSLRYIAKVWLIGLLLLLGVNPTGIAHAQGDNWGSIGPDGGSITALAIDPVTPSILYAGTDGGGVFKSANGGDNWIAVNTGLINNQVRALAIDPVTPSTLYAGT